MGRHRRRRRHPTPSGDSDSAVSANSSVFRHFRNSVDRICNRPKTTILESIDPHVPIKIPGVDVSQPQRASFRPQLFHRASRTVRGTTRSASHRRSKKPSSTMACIAQIRAVPATVAPRLSLRSNRRAGASHSPTFPTRRRDGHEAAARPGLGGVEARDKCRIARANADDSSRVPSETFVSTGASPPDPLDRTDLASSQRQPHVYPLKQTS